ncbi:hypothetical protein LWH94_10035 [Marinobacter sp. G11]|uniref:hypothetical protein n=1 Tax=Marinobacter sp. G11 TaxID=2903522 RepID=UPI001E2D16DD|nr:hypothetical protein [Marinobacter sp. G11]MCE0759542.1 hypothetical protein [Marinobacter sp. G11]
MRTEQDFQRIYEELNLTPSEKQFYSESSGMGFEICTVLKDVEVSYSSSTQYVDEYAAQRKRVVQRVS